MSMTVRHIYYGAIAVIALIVTWYHGIHYIQEGGSVTNPLAMFAAAYYSGNPASSFLTADILAVWMVFVVWVFVDCVKIGMGKKSGAIFIALSYLGVCFALPVYLIVKDRYLAQRGGEIEAIKATSSAVYAPDNR